MLNRFASHSALTDFLASHNISAQQIQTDYEQRQRDARRLEEEEPQPEDEEDKENEDGGEDVAERQKRKRKEEKALLKIRQSKEFKRRKFEAKKRGSDDEDDDTIARTMMAKAKPLPGQLDNCETCGKRFTVTPYSKTGSEGGLLCGKCSKELKDEEKKVQAQEKKKKPAPKGRKRQTESDRMMGDVKPGAKSLAEQCVRKVADVVNDIEEFGDMPQYLLDRLSQILSKKRVLNSRTLDLFLRPENKSISIYDCGKLESEDFIKIFSFMPDLETVNLRFAGQFKNEALQYMINKNEKVRHLTLGAANLVSNETWEALFDSHGQQLETLKLSELNDSMHDDCVASMVASCQNLHRLKLRSCSHQTEATIENIASSLRNLEHLSLAIAPETPVEGLIELVKNVGPKLKTLSLENFNELDDSVLAALKQHCQNLSKLRIIGSSACTDSAFADLFTNWSNPAIPFIDLSQNRDLADSDPDDTNSDTTGFGPLAFKAMMSHSASALERLDLHSDRAITNEALLDVFDPDNQYPALKNIDLSFVTHVDDVVMTSMWRSCPALTKLAVFACFNARGVERIPARVAVIGLPNAADRVVVEGDMMES